LRLNADQHPSAQQQGHQTDGAAGCANKLMRHSKILLRSPCLVNTWLLNQNLCDATTHVRGSQMKRHQLLMCIAHRDHYQVDDSPTASEADNTMEIRPVTLPF
jgi:hypothetical protein